MLCRSFVASSMVGLFGVLPVWSAGEKKNCLVLEQVTNVHGAVTTYVQPEAVKVVFHDVHGFLIARAPSWQVMLVNQDSKIVFQCDYDQWLKRLIRRSYLSGEEAGQDKELPKPEKGGKTLCAGKTCTWYFIKSQDPKAANQHIADYFLLETPLAAKQGCRLLEKWFAVPFVDAVPLAMKFTEAPVHAQANKSKDTGAFAASYDPVDCKQISEKPMPDDFFAYPQNLKKVTSELQIFSTQKQKDEMENILEELGGEPKPGAEKNKSSLQSKPSRK